MDRDVLLERFRGTATLRDAAQWYGQAQRFRTLRFLPKSFKHSCNGTRALSSR